MESRDAVDTIEGRLRALKWRREVLAEARERETARWRREVLAEARERERRRVAEKSRGRKNRPNYSTNVASNR